MAEKRRFGSSEAIAESYDGALRHLDWLIDLFKERGSDYDHMIRDAVQSFDMDDLAVLPDILDEIDGFTEALPGVVYLGSNRKEVMEAAKISALLEEQSLPPHIEHFVPADRLMTAVDFIITAADIRNTATRFKDVFNELGSLHGVLYELKRHVGNVDVRAYHAAGWLNAVIRSQVTHDLQQIIGEDSDLRVSFNIGTYQTSRHLPEGLSDEERRRRLQAPCWYAPVRFTGHPIRSQVYAGGEADMRDFRHVRDSMGKAGLTDVAVSRAWGASEYPTHIPISNAPVLFASRLAEAGVEMSAAEVERASYWPRTRGERLKHSIATYRAKIAEEVAAVG